MTKKNTGIKDEFIRVPREFFSGKSWNDTRTFSECEAWLDLIQSARFEATTSCGTATAQGRIDGDLREMIIERGQLLASNRFLAKRWGWSSERKVRNFLLGLRSIDAVVTDLHHGVTRITILDFEKYCPTDDGGEAASAAATDANDLKPLEESKLPAGETTFPVGTGEDFARARARTRKEVYSVYQGENKRISTSCSGSRYEKSDAASRAVVERQEPPHPQKAVRYAELVDFFNEHTGGVFGAVKMPLSATRRGMINARIREYGEDMFHEAILRAAKSDFLRGQNRRGWRATFDWIIRPTNFEKVISGNYDNERNNKQQSTAKTGGIDEEFLRNVAEGITRGYNAG